MKTVYEVLMEMLGEEQAALFLDSAGSAKHMQRIAALTRAMGALSEKESEVKV